MIDERREAQASLFVLGALPEDEVHDFQRAMRRDLALQMLVRELSATADTLVAAFPRVAPPPALKDRILAHIDTSPAGQAGILGWPGRSLESSPSWLPWALAACFAMLCVVLIYVGNSFRQQVASLRDELDESTQRENEGQNQRESLQTQAQRESSNYVQRLTDFQTQLVRKANDFQKQKEALEKRLSQKTADIQRQTNALQRQIEQRAAENQLLVAALAVAVAETNRDHLAQMRLALLSPTPETAPKAMAASVWDTKEQKGMLTVENLPPLPPERDYQLWLFDPKILSPISAGVFRTDERGKVSYQYKSSASLESVEKLAVSIERKGGVPLPQGKVVLVSN